jgi:hypothetical protein
MRMSWVGTVTAMVAAVALLGTGVVVAKPHDDHGKSDNGAPGQGKGHGKPDAKPEDGSGKKKGPGRPDGSAKGGGEKGCDLAVSSAIQAFVDLACPCEGPDDGSGGTLAWKNHGGYVRCVAHAVKTAASASGVKRRCVRTIVPCAARSTCGKKRAVTCVIATTGVCADGLCDGDAERPCGSDADCAAATCSVTNAERCADLGGTAGSGSCCAASPSGAFVE